MSNFISKSFALAGCLTTASLLSYRYKALQFYQLYFQNHTLEEIREGDLSTSSIDGERCSGHFIDNNADKLLVILNDYFDNHFPKEAISDYFVNEGYDILVLKYTRKIYTFGIKESIDLAVLLNQYLKLKPNNNIYLYGQGLGGTILLSYLVSETPNNIKACIVDDSYLSLNDFIESKIQQELKLINTYPLLKFMDWYYKEYYGFSISNLNYLDMVNNNEIPILFASQAKNNLIAKTFYSQNKGYKKYFEYPDDYEVDKYLKTINKFLKML